MNADRRPLTAAQQALWIAQSLDPHNPTYLCAHRVDLDGPLDTDRLLAAITEVVAQTEVLHTGFATDGDQVWRVPQPAPPVELIDLADETAVARWIDADLSVAPPLSGAALSRQALLRTGPGRTVWYVRAHHLLLDGYAFSMVTERVIATYLAKGRGEAAAPAAFRPLDALLDDERAYQSAGRAAADREFWRDRLAGAPEPARLADRSAAPAHRRAQRRTDLPADAGNAIRAAADRLGATWAEVAFAVTALYLHRITGATDLTLGMPVAGRLGTVAARIPSSVVNVLPLRLAVPPRTTVRTLVAGVQRELRSALRHQRYRYEWLQRDLGLVGTGRRLFGPQVNVKPFRRVLDLGDGVTARVHYLATGPVEDIEITVGTDTGTGAMDLTVDANPLVYDDVALDGHFARLRVLLTRFADLHPDTPVAEVEVLTGTERDLVLHRWNDTAHPVLDRTLTDLLEQQAARTPDAIAVRAEGAELTYAHLHERADRLARWLTARGARPGALVAVALPRGVDLMVALLGVLKSGAAYLPLDLSYPAQRREFMVGDARPVQVLDALPDLREVPDVATVAAGPGDAAYAIYTSGSTGRPKGVLVPHRAIVNRLLWMQDRYRLTAADRVLQKTPSGFDVSVWEFFWPLLTGATLVTAEPQGHKDPAYLADLIAREGIGTVHFVPSMLRVFLAEPSAARTAGVLRRVICSGEELPEDLAREFHRVVGARLHNLYGPTEAAVDVTAWECAPGDPPGPVPIGRPVWNTRIYLLDPGGRPVPPGVAGELHIAGIQVASGYLRRPELTAERFVADPWGGPGDRMYRTGDLARWRPDGAIEFLGRMDGQVKIRGFRVELGEIEAVLAGHPRVRRAAVALAGGRICAYVVGELEPEHCRAYLSTMLPEHMVPAAVVALDDLPLTPSGKLDRRALPAPAPRTSGAAPRTPAQAAIAGLVAQVLGVAPPGPDDNFFDLGGHSLLAATLVRRIREELGTSLPLAAVFAAPTPAGLAARLHTARQGGDAEREGDEALGVLLPLRPAPDGPALFCVHPAGGLSWCYAGLLPHLHPSVAVYGIQAPGLTGRPAGRSLAETARDYARRIREARPRGPYALAGWSVGGVLAHAVAVELRAAGERVVALALLDAYPADQWRDLPTPTRTDALRAVLHMAGRDESAVDGTVSTAAVLDVLRHDHSPMAALGESVLAAIPDVVVDNARMMREHRHRRYDGDAVLYVAGAPRSEHWLDPGGWRPYLGGTLTVRRLDCTHPGMMGPIALDFIGRDLSRLLVTG
ncbi:non-ribosomal peptide synthetase [Mangrovihabitans endophyticus]|uniref:Enterobactin synthase subunit F n=1 Tax=Mangrovihabitans endophyticus TaxID=1751298 RepID=A0A8J3BWQ3_9ACTN|nr:non-ribosomal peptide synthetase [Mangrovihabitans endophyticus]GGK77143.1 enterobactin synthase subunit F [Mangrovihabitans endophyticus]